MVEFRFGRSDGYCALHGIKELADGKILVWGTYESSENGEIVSIISKLTPAGRPDLTFGTNGHCWLNAVADVPVQLAFSTSVSVNPDNSLNIACHKLTAPYYPNWIMRLTPEGFLDGSFNKGELLEIAVGRSCNLMGLITINHGTHIIAYGDAIGEDRQYSFLQKFDINGILDTAFGERGTAVVSVEPKTFINVAAPNDDQEGVIISGFRQDSTPDMDSLLWQYTSAGVADTRFNRGNAAVYTFGTMIDEWTTASQRDDSRIIVSGSGNEGPTASSWSVIGRFLPTGEPDDTLVEGAHFCSPSNARIVPVSDTSVVISGPQQILCAGNYNNQAAVFALKV